MQTLTIQKSVIEQSISNMQSAINKKHAIDITSNIMFEVIDNKLILKATDHEFYIKTTLTPNHTENAIKGAVNGESISNVMKSLEDGEIILEELLLPSDVTPEIIADLIKKYAQKPRACIEEIRNKCREKVELDYNAVVNTKKFCKQLLTGEGLHAGC